MTISSVSAYTPVTTSGQITYTGLGNGTDFNSLITKLVQVEQGRITTLQTWKQSWTDKQTAFQKLNSEMLSLKTTLEGMDSVGEFLSKTTDSTDSTILAVTTGANADNGSHSITVNRLATAKAMSSKTGYTSATEDINPSSSEVSFNYTYKGVTYSNAIGANCTLTDLASIINNDPKNPGVKASIVNDGSKYYLQLRGMDTGDSASLTIANNSGLSGFTNADFNTITNNASAQLKLDGWPTDAGVWITRETNSVTDLLSGLTLNLKSTGTVDVTTTTDTATVKKNIQTFVEQMNTVRTLLQDLTKFDSTTQQASILTGNYGLQLIDTNLKTAVAGKGIGFDYTTDKYSTLAQLGIATDASEGSTTEGLLVIDDDVLDDILSSNADAVAQLFSAQYVGSTDSSEFSISSYISGTTKCGTYDLAYTTDSSGKITGATINGNPAIYHSNSNTITGSHGYPEAGLVIKAIDVSPGVHTGKVSLKEGKTGELASLLDQMTDTTNGPLHILDENYDDITAMIDDKIAFEQRRISTYAANLRKRFAKVDSLLSVYSQQQSQLSSQIAQLTDD
ncbi:flagellar hook-associated 2 domain-containing protein [Solidesulfovibrio carbinoliphilus subsp. oakridgensis]|uniref:Flagellar hook-associated protein 2 n=1 Tax=Solidesulfovibrio carbinoliphilus subsp. oakridgensis TaxID=694327 RepID=G7QAD3_9BACT|nr:flagellar filament capping protein FliD [Solidesulfovibrio carbinoliphilus]EHJ48686.1 flagellar hook-associated 2 domain-containing protein [Solidesulfovibrio carbinoliphilus subsp. oakridgensis]